MMAWAFVCAPHSGQRNRSSSPSEPRRSYPHIGHFNSGSSRRKITNQSYEFASAFRRAMSFHQDLAAAVHHFAHDPRGFAAALEVLDDRIGEARPHDQHVADAHVEDIP